MTALRGITWDHPRGYAPLEACSRAYAERSGIEIGWDRRTLQAFADRPLSLLAREYDLLIIDHPHLGEAMAEGALVALDTLLPASLLRDLADASIGPSFPSYGLAGHQWALPIDAAAQVSAYRPDLLARPPANWAEMMSLAERGLVLTPLKPVDAIDAFMTLVAHLGSPVGMEGDWVDQAVAYRALDALVRLAERLPALCLDQDPIACLDLMSGEGDYAYAPLLFGYTNYSRPGFRPNPIRFADMMALDDRPPIGSILGGAGIAVSAYSAHGAAAAAFAGWIAGAEVQGGCYIKHGGQPAHAAAWNDDQADRLTGGFFSGTRATMDGAWLRPRDNGFLSFADTGGDLVNDCLRGQRDMASTLDALKRAHSEAQAAPTAAARRFA